MGTEPSSSPWTTDGDRSLLCTLLKAKNVVTLSVNKIFAQPGIGVPGVSSTDTNNPLFIGGHPRPRRFGIHKSEASFQGCMKDVVVEGKPTVMTKDRIIGDVHSHVCPTI